MSPTAPAIVYGTAYVANYSTETLQEMFQILEEHKVTQLDTARTYVNSEKILGDLGAAKKFKIQTKAPAWLPGSMKKQNILDGMAQSLKDLGTDSVDIYYLHAPDPTTPIEETLSAIRDLYTQGKFKRFGLSNYTAAQVQNIYDIQAAANSVLPTVFQGNYNAVSRHVESGLFPLLHKLNISFYAYSPIAGGFLVKDVSDLRNRTDTGNFSATSLMGSIYMELYGKESIFEAVEEWGRIAEEAGITRAALAYRWIAWHSALKAENGDAVIVGASRGSQLEETLRAVEEGPLPEGIAERAGAIWKGVEREAPVDNYHSFMKERSFPGQ